MDSEVDESSATAQVVLLGSVVTILLLFLASHRLCKELCSAFQTEWMEWLAGIQQIVRL